MAINLNHTFPGDVTLKGPSSVTQESYTFLFPALQSAQANLMISGYSTSSAISGLQDALLSKVDNSATGSAASKDVGLSVGNLVELTVDGKIPDSLIPSISIRDVFTVASTGELVALSSAQIGDIAINYGDKLNYILASTGVGAYQTLSNWKELKFTDQLVTKVNNLQGDVVLDGSNVYITSGNYNEETIDYAVQNLYATKVASSSLTNYATTGYVSYCLSSYSTTSDVNTCLADYKTTGAFASDIANYSTTLEISSCLTGNYVPLIDVGNAIGLNVGTSAGDLVQLDGGAKIPSSLMPKLSLTDTFVIESTGSLTTLTEAEHGDLAIVTGTAGFGNYILSGSSYSNVSDWQVLAAAGGTVQKVNDVDPIGGSVVISSSDIAVSSSSTIYDTCTISYALSGLDSRISSIFSDYVTQDSLSGTLLGYETTGAAQTAFDGKSDIGHGHEIAEITGLSSCLEALTTFYTGAGSYSATQYAQYPANNQALGDYSVALGYGAKAVQDFEVAHAGGIPTWTNGEVGDAQHSKLVQKFTTNSSALTDIGSIQMDTESVVLYSASVVGYAPSKYAAFKIEGSATRGVSAASLLEANSTSTYVNTDSVYFADVVADGNNLTLVVSGDASEDMKWVSDVSVTKIRVQSI